MRTDPTGDRDLDDAPPVLGSWRTIYLVVLGTLAALVVALTVLTEVLG